jgi:hypothetical protein
MNVYQYMMLFLIGLTGNCDPGNGFLKLCWQEVYMWVRRSLSQALSIEHMPFRPFRIGLRCGSHHFGLNVVMEGSYCQWGDSVKGVKVLPGGIPVVYQ